MWCSMYNKKSQQILVDARESFRNKTGIGVVARNLCKELCERSGYQCVPTDYLSRTPPINLKRNFFQLIGNLFRHIIWKQIYLPLKMASSGARLLFCPDPISPLFAPGKVILLVHDLMFYRQPELANRWWGIYWRTMLPLCLRRADKILAVSESTRKELNSLFGIDLSLVNVTYEGFDKKFYPVKNNKLLTIIHNKYKLPNKFVLFIGAIEPRRNLETLLHALTYLRSERGMAIPLVIAGGATDYLPHLEKMVSNLELSNQVTWLGYVPDNDLPLLYNAAAMYVYPSLMEGFGLTVLEAMACGCPVICSRVDSLPEVAGDAGVLIPPYDATGFAEAIHRVWTEPGLAETMRKKGLAQAQQFSWHKMAEIVDMVCTTTR